MTVSMIEGASDRAIADWLEAHVRAALAESAGPVSLCVPGGSTPFPILAELVARDLDFARLVVWPNDDRIVPEDHEASNTGKLRALLEPVGAQVVALTEDSAPPNFALTWLGMGDDGHIASLFPNTDPQADEPRSVLRLTPDPLPAHAPFDRITLTMPALLDTAAVLFVVRGAAKRAVLDAAVAGQSDLPVARLLAARGDRPVTCFT
jgi:6-phosphogluconolactonase